MAAAAGLELDGKSEINANAKDTKDYPRGVWTLPPSYREGDNNRDKYTARSQVPNFSTEWIILLMPRASNAQSR